MFLVDGIFYRNNGNGTVSVSYDLRNPMHMSAKNTYVLTDYTGEVNVPSSITANGTTYTVVDVTEGAFMYNTSLTKVTLPENLKSMGVGTFMACRQLIEVTIPESVTAIGEKCFFSTNSAGYPRHRGSRVGYPLQATRILWIVEMWRYHLRLVAFIL